VNTPNKEITAEEIQRVEEAATVVQLPANREIIQVFARGYRLDGQENIRDPSGMNGVRLEVDAHIVTATSPAVRNLEKVMDGVDIAMVDRLMSGIGATNAVLGREQREHGAALIDIGGGTTNIAVIEEGDLQHVAVLPVGGINLTNDLAIGLRTDLDVAEKLKLAFSGSDGKKTIKLRSGKKEYSFERAEVEMFLQARLDEIFELVNRELAKINRVGKLPGGVVLVGGTSNLDGITNVAKHALKLPARVAQPSGFSGITEQIDSPEYTTVVGLMLHHFSLGTTSPMKTKSGDGLKSQAAKAGGFAKDLIKKFKP
jgi:cell division protein FtsA